MLIILYIVWGLASSEVLWGVGIISSQVISDHLISNDVINTNIINYHVWCNICIVVQITVAAFDVDHG